jgi:hypothetical protein
MFSVRSAYKLALQQEHELANRVGSSSRPDSNRHLYKGIWDAKVPPKVQIFAWRLAQEGLATQCNRKTRNLMEHATCQICGVSDEDGYHAVVECPRARALRKELRRTWLLPVEEKFQHRGLDWLLLLLDSVEMGAYILLMFWRAWFLRNDIMHGKGNASIGASVGYLTAYAESLQVGESKPGREVDAKGKAKVLGHHQSTDKPIASETSATKRVCWEPPPERWVKINSDAGFDETSGEASARIIITDAYGGVMLSAWQMVTTTKSICGIGR